MEFKLTFFSLLTVSQVTSHGQLFNIPGTSEVLIMNQSDSRVREEDVALTVVRILIWQAGSSGLFLLSSFGDYAISDGGPVISGPVNENHTKE